MARTFADLERALRQKLVFILNQPPVADPGPIPDGKPDTEPYRCNTGQTITLDGSGSRDPDGQIAKYEWDFNGDGTPDATGPKVSFTCPTAPGSITITLTVTDAAGVTTTAQQTIIVTQAPAAQSAAHSKLRDCSRRGARRPDGPARRLRVL
jgi:hypothetical protein